MLYTPKRYFVEKVLYPAFGCTLIRYNVYYSAYGMDKIYIKSYSSKIAALKCANNYNKIYE